MRESWLKAVSVVLVGMGAAAEINLARALLRDWRAGRRAARPRASGRRRGHSGADAGPVVPRRSRLSIAAFALAPAIGGLAQAQDAIAPAPTPAATEPASQPAPPEEKGSPYHLQLNFDYTTAYFYHGIIQEDSGLILQPAARLTVNLYEHEDWKVDGILGVWTSFHGQKTGARTHSDFTEYWYEADLIGGVAVTKGKVSLTTTYTFLTSPTDAYETVQELDLTLGYDDSDLLGKFALHPYALLGIETGADASDGADSDAGTYLELGVAPGFSVNAGETPITISFPVSVGLSLDDYYQNATGDDNTFGFVQVGAKASVPLPIGKRYGAWILNAGVSVLLLGDHTSDYNAGDDTEVIATVGVQVNF